MGYRALATDVDGTLTKKGRGISLKAFQAIRGLEGRRIPVILASASPFPVLNILREYIGCSGAVICENGGHVEYHGEARILGDRADGLETYRRLRESLVGSIVEAWTNNYSIVDVALNRTIPRPEVQRVVGALPSLKLLDSGFFYHIMPADVEKGRGLRAAVELMGMEASDVVAIGDSEVDMDLLRAAGFDVAVSDSSEGLKVVADLVTEGPDGEGFCEAVRRLF